MAFYLKVVLVLTGILASETFAFQAYPKSTLGLPDRLEFDDSKKAHDGNVMFTGHHFLTEQRTSSESENYGYLGLAFTYQDRKGNFDWKADLIFEGSVNEANELYYGAPELFMRLNDDSNRVKITIGRQKRRWSELDQRLGLGVWQPQLRWDYLNPVQQGLAGAFFDMDAAPVHITLFASPIFLPDQGPQFKVRNGRFESPSRWFWQPQTRLRLGEGSSNLFYELETPPVDKIVMNSSLGGMLEIDPVGPFQMQMAYAYKPMNQFFIGIECSECVDPLTTDGTAKIHPLVMNHHVFTAESRLVYESDKFLFSWTVDRPVDPDIPKDWWAGTEIRSVSIPGVSYERNLSLFSRPVVLGLDYFQEISGDRAVNRGGLLTSVESSADRYSFADLLSLTGHIEFFSGKKSSLSLSSRYSYSFKERGAWLNSKVSYRRDKMESFVAFDVLGSQTEPLSSEAGLFSRYRSNDRVYGGFGFVF